MSLGSQSALEARMQQCITISRPTETDAGDGKFALTFSEVEESKARLFPVKVQERRVEGRESVEVTHKLLVPCGTNIQRSDRVDDGTGTGPFEVVSVVQGAEAHHMRAELQVDQRGR